MYTEHLPHAMITGYKQQLWCEPCEGPDLARTRGSVTREEGERATGTCEEDTNTNMKERTHLTCAQLNSHHTLQHWHATETCTSHDTYRRFPPYLSYTHMVRSRHAMTAICACVCTMAPMNEGAAGRDVDVSSAPVMEWSVSDAGR